MCSLRVGSARALRAQVSEKQGGQEGREGEREKIHLPSSFPQTHNALHQLGSSTDPAHCQDHVPVSGSSAHPP